jgi:hypothetical protein
VSRHVKFIEGELIRVRLEKDAYIRTLQEEKTSLLAKIDKLELAIWPLASRSGAIYAAPPHHVVSSNTELKMPATTYAQAMEEHIAHLNTEEPKEN